MRHIFPLSFSYSSCHHRALHSFPTRRSSDLYFTSFQQVTICKQNRIFLICFDTRRKNRQHIRTIWIKSNFTEPFRSEEHTSELQSRENLVCRLLLEKKKGCTKINELKVYAS